MRFRLPILALLAAAGLARAHPHNAPTLSANVFVGEREVVCKVAGVKEIVEPWLAQGAERFFHEHCPVSIDGARVAPLLRGQGPPDGYTGPDAQDFLELAFHYPCDAPPRSVGIRWGEFEGADWQGENVVPLMIKAGRDVLLRTVEPGEPEFVWHAAPGFRQRRERPEAVRNEEGPAKRRTYPTLAAVCLGFGLLGCAGLRRRPLLAGLWFFVCCAGSLVLVRGHAVAKPFEMPSETQARTIFEQLQRNIYDAFDAETEDRIYDLLAVSVTADELDDLYADVYESLILREQGGAVTQVEKIEVLDGHVTLPRPEEQDRRFFVDWKWRVHCAITHWGHTHRRINEYAAKYTVAYDGGSWKISDVDVLEQERLDLDAESQPEAKDK